MSKKEIDFDKLDSKKTSEIKKVESEIDTEKAVALIHDQQPEKERTKRITIELPFSLYVEVKKQIVEEEKTLKDYFMELANTNINH